MQQIRFAAFDLDGTLLDDKGRLFEGVVQGIQAVVDHGLLPVVVTGRTLDSFLSLNWEPAFLDLFDDQIVCSDGNLLFHKKTRSLHVRDTLPPDVFPLLWELLRSEADFIVEMGGRHYASTKKAVLQYCMLYLLDRPRVQVADFASLPVHEATRIVVFPSRELKLPDHEAFKSCAVAYLPFLYSILITPDRACKAQGLQEHLRSRYQEPDLSKVIAFGDNLNDCRLLQESGIGVAVQGSHPAANTENDKQQNMPIGDYLLQAFTKK